MWLILPVDREYSNGIAFTYLLDKAHLVVSLRETVRPCGESKKQKTMASYHCCVKVGSKGKAASHAAYISRDGKYSERERYEDLESSAYGNMPKWAEHNPAHFWQAADEYERANGATYREIEVALPRELNSTQRRQLVEDFIAKEIGNKHAYQWAIHTPKAALEKGDQPHAHIMYSERTIDGIDRDPDKYFKRFNAKAPEMGGCRKDSAGTEERLQHTRERWATVQNVHLERHGHTVRVDHRTLEAQGIERPAEKHLGGQRIRLLKEADISALLERRAAEGERERAQKAVSSLIDLSADLTAAKAERDRQQAECSPALLKRMEQGVADFERRFEERVQIEEGMQSFAERFAQWDAKQQAAQELARQREEAERKRQVEMERKRERSHKGPTLEW